MKPVRTVAQATTLSILTLLATGCAVTRGQETVGSYIDDATITTAVKAKLLEDKTTGGLAIGVETLNGTVSLSGFATSQAESAQAETLARSTKGVKAVRNHLVVRPPAS